MERLLPACSYHSLFVAMFSWKTLEVFLFFFYLHIPTPPPSWPISQTTVPRDDYICLFDPFVSMSESFHWNCHPFSIFPFFLCRRQSQEKERRKKRWRFLSSEIETIPRVEGEVRWLALFKHAIKMTQIWNYWYTFFFLTWWIGGRRYEIFPWASTAPSNILFRSIVMQLTQSSRQKLGDTLDPSVQLWVVWPVDGLIGPGLYAEVGQNEKNSFQFEILAKSPSGRFWSS